MSIRFAIDGVNYEVQSATTPDLIALPDGRVIRPLAWLETYPPQLDGYETVATPQATVAPMSDLNENVVCGSCEDALAMGPSEDGTPTCGNEETYEATDPTFAGAEND